MLILKSNDSRRVATTNSIDHTPFYSLVSSSTGGLFWYTHVSFHSPVLLPTEATLHGLSMSVNFVTRIARCPSTLARRYRSTPSVLHPHCWRSHRGCSPLVHRQSQVHMNPYPLYIVPYHPNLLQPTSRDTSINICAQLSRLVYLSSAERKGSVYSRSFPVSLTLCSTTRVIVMSLCLLATRSCRKGSWISGK